MATLLARIRVTAGREAEFEAIAADLYRETLAKDSGVLRYEYWRGSDPGSYYSLLAFSDFNAFLRHQVSEHHEAAGPKIGEVCDQVELEWVDPVPESSPLPRTHMQELPAGADDKTTLYHKVFAAKIQSWWPR
jgi:quinol monooxygenase YgiN